jgi:hypothetical protein
MKRNLISFGFLVLVSAGAISFPIFAVDTMTPADQNVFSSSGTSRVAVATGAVTRSVMFPVIGTTAAAVPATVSALRTGAAATPHGPAFKPFYIYSDEKTQNHYYPSGWMGDTQDLKLSGAYQNDPRLGKTCLRVTYLAKGSKEWAGIYWQNPPNNWGTAKGGYNLSGAAYLTFWARGQDGGERINEFKIGGISGKYPDSDVAWIGPISLKKSWTQYRIKLEGKDLSYINGGFCFTLLRNDNPRGCTFYLNEMRYE